ncbi:hypothetical protein [Streptomyces sp. NBC_01497]|uniref:hypothetical protein n=1 Tax=Streptomyces sp. NBC_01497 TaxID=2903885 RepID=UPI002E36D707|nr:hypothetical protein [Streptomyces sp. NBC_01497]
MAQIVNDQRAAHGRRPVGTGVGCAQAALPAGRFGRTGPMAATLIAALPRPVLFPVLGRRIAGSRGGVTGIT